MPTELTKASILTELKTIMDDAEAKNVISMDEATYGSHLVEKLHALSSDAELSEETLFVNAETMSDDEEVQNTTLTDQGTMALQLVKQLHQQGDETGSSVPPSEITNKVIDSEHVEVELSRETTFVNAKTMSEAEEVETTTSIDLVTNNMPQLLEEVQQQDGETGISVPSAEFSNKVSDSDAKTLSQDQKVENCPGQSVEDLPRQENETELTISEKLVVEEVKLLSDDDPENIILFDLPNMKPTLNNDGQLVEGLPRQENETELTIPSVEISEKLVSDDEEVKLVSDDEPENIILFVHANGQQIVEELRQDNETRFSDENVVANLKPTLKNDGMENTVSTGHENNDPHLAGDISQHGDETELGITVGNIQVLVVEEMKTAEESHEESKLKSTVNEKRTEIAEELKSLNAEMDQKSKKIEEIAQKVVAIDNEISQMKSECSESKCRHAEFIELFKFMDESQLPLGSHREIKLFMKKKDRAAHEFLSKALDLQYNIDARAKLKLSLQEETTELGKLVEAQKLKMHQKLKENDELAEFINSCRKRKLHPDEEFVEPKRMALNGVDSPQECIDHCMLID